MTPFRAALMSMPPMLMASVSGLSRPVSRLMVVVFKASLGVGKTGPFAAADLERHAGHPRWLKKTIADQRPPTALAPNDAKGVV